MKIKEIEVKEIKEENKEIEVMLYESEKDGQRNIVERDESKRDRKYGK